MIRTWSLYLSSFIFLAATQPLCSFAYDFNQLQINGFMSQGYLKSQDNNIIKDSTNGAFQINEVGLTFNLPVNDKLRLGLQLLSRDFGEEGNNKIQLDWAFADYAYQDWLGLRIGKIKIPIGLHNESRDSDFLRQMAFLPQSVYDENKRNLLVAAQGGSLYGNLPGGFLGDFDYTAFYGQINFPEDSPLLDTLQAAATEFATNSGLGFRVIGLSPNNQYVYGGSLINNTPMHGLRFGASYFQGRTNFDAARSDFGPAESITVRMLDQFVYSLEYALPRMTFTTEYIEYRQRKNFFHRELPTGKSQGWYFLLTLQLTDKLAFSTLYDTYYENSDDRDGSNFTLQGKPDHMGWRKDLGLGLRYDINFNWLLKLEWHKIDGTALLSPVINSSGLQGNWDYYICKASFNF